MIYIMPKITQMNIVNNDMLTCIKFLNAHRQKKLYRIFTRISCDFDKSASNSLNMTGCKMCMIFFLNI